MDKASLNHWKNKVKNINKEYFEIYYPDSGGIRMKMFVKCIACHNTNPMFFNLKSYRFNSTPLPWAPVIWSINKCGDCISVKIPENY